MGLNGSPRSRKNLKIWEPELFFNPDRLAGSPGAPGPLKISKNQFFDFFFEFLNPMIGLLGRGSELMTAKLGGKGQVPFNRRHPRRIPLGGASNVSPRKGFK